MDKKKSTPKAKGFTKEELQGIKEKLLEEKVQIMAELDVFKDEGLNKSFKDSSGDLSGYSFHMADMASDLHDREMSLGLAEGERERLYAINDAIKRIEEGTYGTCDYCNESISKQRLKVMPQAKYCIKCQEKEEKSTNK